jgi:hypothetical protein
MLDTSKDENLNSPDAPTASEGTPASASIKSKLLFQSKNEPPLKISPGKGEAIEYSSFEDFYKGNKKNSTINSKQLSGQSSSSETKAVAPYEVISVIQRAYYIAVLPQPGAEPRTEMYVKPDFKNDGLTVNYATQDGILELSIPRPLTYSTTTTPINVGVNYYEPDCQRTSGMQPEWNMKCQITASTPDGSYAGTRRVVRWVSDSERLIYTSPVSWLNLANNPNQKMNLEESVLGIMSESTYRDRDGISRTNRNGTEYFTGGINSSGDPIFVQSKIVDNQQTSKQSYPALGMGVFGSNNSINAAWIGDYTYPEKIIGTSPKGTSLLVSTNGTGDGYGMYDLTLGNFDNPTRLNLKSKVVRPEDVFSDEIRPLDYSSNVTIFSPRFAAQPFGDTAESKFGGVYVENKKTLIGTVEVFAQALPGRGRNYLTKRAATFSFDPRTNRFEFESILPAHHTIKNPNASFNGIVRIDASQRGIIELVEYNSSEDNQSGVLIRMDNGTSRTKFIKLEDFFASQGIKGIEKIESCASLKIENRIALFDLLGRSGQRYFLSVPTSSIYNLGLSPELIK